MTGTAMYNQMMAQTTFGSCANAASCCAKIAAMDAIFVASIIICGLISLSTSILGIVLVLLVGLVICGKVNSHRARRSL